MKVFSSGYQSIDMPCIVAHVKFESGLFYPGLRKKQLLTKKGGQKFTFSNHFNHRHLEKVQIIPLEKVPLFRSQFSCERNRKPTITFDIDLAVLYIYRLIPRKSCFLESIVFFNTAPISRFLGASFSVHDSTHRKSASF
jgi:hypothetical protein